MKPSRMPETFIWSWSTFIILINLTMVVLRRYCEGGELFDRIIAQGKMTEAEARLYFTQMMQALNYCHSNKICHRDLKPENFLLLTKAKDSPIKIIDFGLSRYISKSKSGKVAVKMTTKAGTVRSY